MQGSMQLILPSQTILILPSAVQYLPLFRPSRCRNSFQLIRGGRYERHDSHDSHIDSISHSIPCALHFFQSSGPSPESDRRRSSVLDSVLFVAVGGFGAIREKYLLASSRRRLSALDISVWPEANRACTSVGRPTQGIIDTR